MRKQNQDNVSSNNNEKKRKTKKSANLTCLRCRSKHIKCDGSQPKCINCSSKCLECEYPGVAKKSGSETEAKECILLGVIAESLVEEINSQKKAHHYWQEKYKEISQSSKTIDQQSTTQNELEFIANMRTQKNFPNLQTGSLNIKDASLGVYTGTFN